MREVKRDRMAFERQTLMESADDLYIALETIICLNAGGLPVSHRAIVAGRAALSKASGRIGQKIDWWKESAKRSREIQERSHANA